MEWLYSSVLPKRAGTDNDCAMPDDSFCAQSHHVCFGAPMHEQHALATGVWSPGISETSGRPCTSLLIATNLMKDEQAVQHFDRSSPAKKNMRPAPGMIFGGAMCHNINTGGSGLQTQYPSQLIMRCCAHVMQLWLDCVSRLCLGEISSC